MNSVDLRPFLPGVFRAVIRLATVKNDEGLEVFGTPSWNRRGKL